MRKGALESANVVAKLEGSDPELRKEYVVLSAHIDHLGIGDPVNGDRIYNGALDNASGCAALLDIAVALTRERVRPRRTVLFVFFTGEDTGPGLMGSKYFTARPTVNAKSIVANINIDTVHALVPMKSLVVLGLDESDMGDAARRAAASQNILIDSESELHPSRLFVNNSDQANFVLHGVPAVRLMVGFPGDLGTVLQKWRSEVYHTPSEDLKQPVNLETAAKFEEIVLQLLLDVANAPHRPEWKSNSFYKRYAAR
jgi:Zn-dependent M28 family amino/carboxypeptidase